MSRIVLGAVFVCLFATSSFATGFEIPWLPDFDLQRDAAKHWGVDRDTITKSIPSTDAARCRAHTGNPCEANQRPVAAEQQ
ncbi:hypothetical protein EV561_104352 [Rhizobium sp. BK376]|jgi:hypothetical protein|nr:hypothetical protein EV561_104352 [Rhizobium sp. BK376]